jgi:hypothetical protein
VDRDRIIVTSLFRRRDIPLAEINSAEVQQNARQEKGVTLHYWMCLELHLVNGKTLTLGNFKDQTVQAAFLIRCLCQEMGRGPRGEMEPNPLKLANGENSRKEGVITFCKGMLLGSLGWCLYFLAGFLGAIVGDLCAGQIGATIGAALLCTLLCLSVCRKNKETFLETMKLCGIVALFSSLFVYAKYPTESSLIDAIIDYAEYVIGMIKHVFRL